MILVGSFDKKLKFPKKNLLSKSPIKTQYQSFDITVNIADTVTT